MPDIKIDATLTGVWTVERFSRVTGEKLPTLLVEENTIQDAGKNIFLDMMFNYGSPASTNQFTNARTDLLIYNTSDVLQKTLDCDASYPSHGSEDSGLVYYWFSDLTADAYEADDLHFKNSTSGVTFSIKLATGWSKPATENWIYKYTLQITQNGDSNLKMDGLDHALRLFSGNRVLLGKQWEASGANRITLLVEDSPKTSTQTIYASSGPTRSSQTVTTVFTQAAGTGTGQDWEYCTIQANMTDQGLTELNETQESGGTKGASEEFVYTFTFSL